MSCKNRTKILLKRTNYIDKTTKIKQGCVLGPNVCLINNTQILQNCDIKNSTIKNCIIGKNCTIFGSYLVDAVIKDNVSIINSVVFNSSVDANSSIGPFCYLRDEAFVGKNCRIGDFVEIKKSKLDDGTKCAHLCYIGDAFVGKNCNIGCGCVFANYDGKIKHKTVVEDNCFLGANVNLVAPLQVGKNCFVGAGTTIRKNLTPNTFVVQLTAQKIVKNKLTDTN